MRSFKNMKKNSNKITYQILDFNDEDLAVEHEKKKHEMNK